MNGPASGTRENIVSQPLHTCLDLIQSHGFGSSVFDAYFMSVLPDLLRDDAVAGILLDAISKEAILKEDSAEDTAFSDVFGLLLDEARMDVENDGLYGKVFLASAETALGALQIKKGFGDPVHMTLVACYGQAGLPVPDTLVLDMESDFDMTESASEFPEALSAESLSAGLEQMLEAVLKEGGTPYHCYLAFHETCLALPDDARAWLVGHVSAMGNPVFEHWALYWLLDKAPLICNAAATGLADRLASAGLHPETLFYLPMLRSWMTPCRARDSVDAIIKKARRRDRFAPTEKPAVTIQEIRASIVDGTGAQSLFVIAQKEDVISLSMVLTKSGHGIKDANVLACASLEEAHQVLAEAQAPHFPVNRQTLELLLQSALADGIEHQVLPAPGLLDVVAQSGFDTLRPQTISAQAWMDHIDPCGAISQASPQKLGRLVHDRHARARLFPLIDCWFEDNETIRSLMASADSSTGSAGRAAETALWAYLETRRDIWAQWMLQTAAILKKEYEADGLFLAASALGLVRQRPLRKIPVMQTILDTTLAAAEALYPEAGPVSAAETQQPLAAVGLRLTVIKGDDYSDRDAAAVGDWVETAFAAFEKDPLYGELNAFEQENGYFMIQCFYDYCYGYHLAGPADITLSITDDVCLDIMPRKVSAPADMFAAFAPAFTRFLTWCDQQEIVSATENLRHHIDKIAPDMIRKAADPGNWGLAKSMLTGSLSYERLTLADHSVSPYGSVPPAGNSIPFERPYAKIGRNEPCPCGSGRKYKKCCLN